MKRLHIHLTEKQKDILNKMSEDSGLKIAELVRRAIDSYIKEQISEYYNRCNMEKAQADNQKKG